MRSVTQWTAGLALALGVLVTSSSSTAAARQEKGANGTLESTANKAVDRAKPAPGQEPAPKPEPKPGSEKPEKTEKPAPAPAPGQDPAKPAPADPRAVANRMAEAVKVHEVRFARLDALISIFQEKKDTVKVERAQSLKTREDARYQTELMTFKQALGDDKYKAVLASLRSTKKGATETPKPKPDEKPAPVERKDEKPAPAERKKEGGR